MILALLALALFQSSDTSLMAPGVSRRLAVHRAAQLRDVRYDLTLDVTSRDTARGTVVVHFARRLPGDVILDFRGYSATVERLNGAPAPAVAASDGHLRLPAAALRTGANQVELRFASAVAAAGASIIRTHDPTDGSDYLYTLLVPSDANALFPCFDQPDLKARVTLTLTTPRGWTALANGRPASTSDSAASTVHRFAETAPISTYLIAFAAGPWKVLGREHPPASGHRAESREPRAPARLPRAPGREPLSMHLLARASRAREVEVDSLVAMNQRAVAWLEDYFAIPFPFAKFDFLLAPAFPFGGMEHPGAVFYNEESFIYRERPTLPQLLGRQATVFHEVAHQWFGDYVTMRWFDDLWLKEGFATFMAAKMQDALSPSTEAWKTFYLRNKPLAYDVDASLGTTPIWQELANLDQAKSNYGAIVYNKAPGVLKQLEYLVGERAFRDGVRTFLRAHAYGNATWRDLLAAIGEASGRSLDEWGRQYILRPGMPVIEQHVDIVDGRIRRLALVQRPAQAVSGRGVWPMRLQLLLAYENAAPVRIPVEISAETTVVEQAVGRPAPTFVYANAGDYAYGLIQLDDRSAAWLETHVGSIDDSFLRAMLWGSMWDLVRDARLSPSRFIAAALGALPAERDEQLVAWLTTRVARAVDSYLSHAQRDSVIGNVERVLLAGASDTTAVYGIRKAQLDAFIALASTPSAVARIDAWLDSASVAGGIPLRPPTRWAIVTKLVSRAHPASESRLAGEARRDSTAEGRRRAFAAGAARPDAETKRVYFERYFADRQLNEDWATASLRAFNDPDQSALTRPYLIPALDSLPWIQQHRRIFFLGSWLGAFLAGQRDSQALAAVDEYLTAHPKVPGDLRLKILQARDELERTVRIRRRFAEGT